MEEAKDDGTEEGAGAEMVGDTMVKSRHIDDSTVRDWNEDRASWTRSISKRGKKTFSKLFKQNSFIKVEESPFEKKETNRDSGVALLDDAVADLNRVGQALEMKKVKLDDLISTEESYLEDLGKIALYYEETMKSKEDPNHPIPMPQGLREGRDLIAFGNIHQIIDFHNLYFSEGLKNTNNDAAKILELFAKKKGDMKIRYGKFCINKPKSEVVVTQFQDSYFNKLESYLRQTMPLADQLIKPVQHLTRHNMYFKVPCMDRTSIPLFSKNKSSTRLEPAHIFLFQQAVIVCYYRTSVTCSVGMTVLGARDEYRYWHKFLINKMQVRDIARGGNEMEFELHDTNKESSSPNMNLTMTTNTMEEKKEWVTKINKEIRGLDLLKGDLCKPRK